MRSFAVNRGGCSAYRPRDNCTLRGGNSALATGAPEPLGELFGQELEMEE